jgi:hypothetical protein
MTLRFVDFKANELQPVTSPSVVSSGLRNSGSNDSHRQAQGLSLSKAAASNTEPHNFEELYFFTQSFFELIKFIIRCWTFISFFLDQPRRCSDQ